MIVDFLLVLPMAYAVPWLAAFYQRRATKETMASATSAYGWTRSMTQGGSSSAMEGADFFERGDREREGFARFFLAVTRDEDDEDDEEELEVNREVEGRSGRVGRGGVPAALWAAVFPAGLAEADADIRVLGCVRGRTAMEAMTKGSQ